MRPGYDPESGIAHVMKVVPYMTGDKPTMVGKQKLQDLLQGTVAAIHAPGAPTQLSTDKLPKMATPARPTPTPTSTPEGRPGGATEGGLRGESRPRGDRGVRLMTEAAKPRGRPPEAAIPKVTSFEAAPKGIELMHQAFKMQPTGGTGWQVKTPQDRGRQETFVEVTPTGVAAYSRFPVKPETTPDDEYNKGLGDTGNALLKFLGVKSLDIAALDVAKNFKVMRDPTGKMSMAMLSVPFTGPTGDTMLGDKSLREVVGNKSAELPTTPAQGVKIIGAPTGTPTSETIPVPKAPVPTGGTPPAPTGGAPVGMSNDEVFAKVQERQRGLYERQLSDRQAPKWTKDIARDRLGQMDTLKRVRELAQANTLPWNETVTRTDRGISYQQKNAIVSVGGVPVKINDKPVDPNSLTTQELQTVIERQKVAAAMGNQPSVNVAEFEKVLQKKQQQEAAAPANVPPSVPAAPANVPPSVPAAPANVPPSVPAAPANVPPSVPAAPTGGTVPVPAAPTGGTVPVPGTPTGGTVPVPGTGPTPQQVRGVSA